MYKIFFLTCMGLLYPFFLCDAEILFDNGRLTVQVEDMPLDEVLQEIGRNGNIAIQARQSFGDQKVTVRLGPLPIEKALSRILKNQNCLIVYDAMGNIVELFVSNKASALSKSTDIRIEPPEPPVMPDPVDLIPPEGPAPVPSDEPANTVE